MNNEPVAWAIKSDGDWTEIGWDDEVLHEVEEWYTAQGWQYEYVPLYTHPAKTLTEILQTIKCIADDVSPHKEYENTYSDGWIDACNTVYDEVFAILRKAQKK